MVEMEKRTERNGGKNRGMEGIEMKRRVRGGVSTGMERARVGKEREDEKIE